MRLGIKLLLILFVIVSFSSGLANTCMLCIIHEPKYLMFSIVSFLLSHEINQEIIEKEENSELDETF